jgi:hypothetical protein
MPYLENIVPQIIDERHADSGPLQALVGWAPWYGPTGVTVAAGAGPV